MAPDSRRAPPPDDRTVIAGRAARIARRKLRILEIILRSLARLL